MAANRSKKLKEIMTTDEVSKILKLKKDDLREFESEGVFDYADKTKKKIDAKNFERLKVALSLKRELGVNTPGIDVILNMRDKMHRMQSDFNTLLIQVRRRLSTKLRHDVEKIQGKRKI